MSASHDVLIMEAAYARLGELLRPFAAHLLLMGPDGVVSRADSGATVVAPQPAGAWYGSDAWFNPLTSVFLDCAAQSPSLRWLHSGNAGIDTPAYARFRSLPIAITTSHGFAPGIADLVLASVLDHWQNGPDRRARREAREWRSAPFREIADSIWLIIGFGAIGREVARRARGFGAHITGVRRNPGSDPLADRVIGMDALPQALPNADVVVLCVALNDATRGLVDAPFLAALKSGATFVNVARGALVDETALLEGLTQRRPGHAILDVVRDEPLSPDSPFWTHPAVTLTPHVAWRGDRAEARNDQAFLANLGRFIRGEPLAGATQAGTTAMEPMS